MQNNESFLSVSEAAKKLKVSRQYIWMLIQLGKLSAQKVVGRYIIPETEINQLLNKKIGGK
jgi:excisionase family DNA binding protein